MSWLFLRTSWTEKRFTILVGNTPILLLDFLLSLTRYVHSTVCITVLRNTLASQSSLFMLSLPRFLTLPYLRQTIRLSFSFHLSTQLSSHSQHQSKLKRAVNVVIFMNHVIPHSGQMHLEDNKHIQKVSLELRVMLILCIRLDYKK